MSNKHLLPIVLCATIPVSPVRADDEEPPSAPVTVNAHTITMARDRGLNWLAQRQNEDGSWGDPHTVAVTSLACLSFLSAANEPFGGERGRMLIRGLEFLLDQQQDGTFPRQGDIWMYGQGAATLALAEAHGRSLSCRSRPEWDMDQVREIVRQAARVIAGNQSTSGGWGDTPDSPAASTTVCAMQALVSAANYYIEIDEAALLRGFDYLKQCQNEDGGFRDSLDDDVSANEVTAAAVATLAMMRNRDESVLARGRQFLGEITPAAISAGPFPYIGHFFGHQTMLGRAFFPDPATGGYVTSMLADLLSWQNENGSWPAKGWVLAETGEGELFATAFATWTLSIQDRRLSIENPPPVERARMPGLTSLRIIDDRTVAVASGGLLQLINEAGSLYDDRHFIDGRDGSVHEKADARPPDQLTFTAGQACELPGWNSFCMFKLLRIDGGRAMFLHTGFNSRNVDMGWIDEVISVAPYDGAEMSIFSGDLSTDGPHRHLVLQSTDGAFHYWTEIGVRNSAEETVQTLSIRAAPIGSTVSDVVDLNADGFRDIRLRDGTDTSEAAWHVTWLWDPDRDEYGDRTSSFD